jgi:AbrB family looped-hinge helix DNA binding protein
MRATIDRAGRVVIPAAVREKAGFTPGTELDIVADDMGVRLVRHAPGPKLVRVGKLLIARATARNGAELDPASLVDEERERTRW